MSLVAISMNLLLAVLLAAALVMGWRLNRRLKALRDSHEGFAQAVADLDAAARYEGAADHLMFDAKPPQDAVIPGGTGARFDWSLMIGRRFARPWFLAGGLDPWNVAEAIALSGAPAVDVSSGVERGPGLKDPALITAFLDAVRRA